MDPLRVLQRYDSLGGVGYDRREEKQEEQKEVIVEAEVLQILAAVAQNQAKKQAKFDRVS